LALSNHRILQVIQAPQHRGAEVFALQLSTALRRRAWTSTVASLFPGDERFVHAAEAAGLWDGTFGDRQPRGLLSWNTLRTMVRHIDASRSSVVQANGAATLKYLATARRLGGRRWRLVYRTIGMPSYWRHDPLRRLAYRWWFRQADLVIAVCRRAAAELVETVGLPAGMVTVIPNGVDAAPFLTRPADVRPRIRGEAAARQEDVVIAHVGSLTAEKNHAALVRVAAAMRERGAPVRLWIIGDGPERTAVERLVRSAGMDRQTWLPGVRSDVADLLAAADLLVLPSLTEGMPAVVIEAGLSRLPVVAYNVGGIDEVVREGQTGMLVPAGDERALQAAVASLVENGGRRRTMGEAARVACVSYEITRIAAQYAEAYAGLLDGRRAGA
jgi:glycosyltransferase involved in cell wall biosynthesis